MTRGPLPTGVVTFVRTDLVELTPPEERSGDAMVRSLARYQKMIENVVQKHDGVPLATMGEQGSSVSVFQRASDAIRAAHQLRVLLLATSWSPDAPVDVRIAVHTGEAVERPVDYEGPTATRAARLCSLARGGEVVVSAVTADVVADALPPGTAIRALGRPRRRPLDPIEPAYLLTCDVMSPNPRDDRRGVLSLAGVSRREAEVLEALGERLTNAEIAARLCVSVRTVESHVSSLLRKLGASNRLELAEQARELDDQLATEPPALPPSLELLADPSTFVGRFALRAVLDDAWAIASAGKVIVAIVAGEAGIGKSRLVAELAADVREQGGCVVLGSCFEDAAQPFGPFLQAIVSDTGRLSLGELRRRAGADAQTLGRLVPKLADAVGETTVVPAGELDRPDVVAALSSWFVRSAMSLPLLLVIEDLHWATPTSREVLRSLARVGGSSPLLVVVTLRSDRPDFDDELLRFVGELERLPPVTVVRVDGLDMKELGELVGPDVDIAAIHAETGGNPLLAGELARAPSTLGSTVSAILARRYERLDAASLELLDTAAVIGAGFGADDVASATDRSLLDTLESLERAVNAGLVVHSQGDPGHFAFTHALFRSSRYQAIPAGRRLQLHGRVARALLERGGDDLSEIARHACLAAPLGEAPRAVELARRAGDEACRAGAYDEAAEQYRRALSAYRYLPMPDEAVRRAIEVGLGEALHRRGDAQGRRLLYAIADEARVEGDGEMLAQVATALSHFGATIAVGTGDQRAIELTEDALARLADESSTLRAVLLADLAVQLVLRGDDVPRGLAAARDAEAAARAAGDVPLLGRILLTIRLTAMHPGRLGGLERIARDLAKIADQTGSTPMALGALSSLAAVHRTRGELAEWERSMRLFRERLGDRHIVFFQLVSATYAASERHLRGDLDGAEALLSDIAELARASGGPTSVWQGGPRLVLARARGRDSDLLVGLQRNVSRGTDQTGLDRCALAAALARTGDVNAAHDVLDDMARGGLVLPATTAWSSSLVEVAEAAEVVGHTDAAASAIGHLRPYSGLLADHSTAVNRPVSQALAQALLATGEIDAAASCARQAVADSRRRGTPVFLARELVFLAEAEHRRGAHRDRLAPFVAEALDLAERTGADVVRQDLVRYGLA